MTATEFRIVISEGKVSARVSRAGDEFTDLSDGHVVSEHLKTVQVLEDWLKRWQLLTVLTEQEPPFRPGQVLIVPDTIELLGSYLWKMVLDNGIGNEILDEHFKVDARHRDNMRVRISFKDAPELALLPWEFLQFPGNGTRRKLWLAAELKLVLGRFVEGPGNIDIALADEKLRVLFIRHLPSGQHYDPQRDACDTLVSTLVKDGTTKDRVDSKVVKGWSPQEVKQAMQSFREAGHRVDVVHLTALFRMNAAGVCEVKLPAGQGRDDWTNADTLVDNVCAKHDNLPSLVVLHLIDQADGDFMQHSEQLAPAFIDGGVPAVLAMQYPMTTKEAHDFLTCFYRALADGIPIGAAVQLSRKELKLHGTSRHFGSPVLYMQSSADGNLIAAPPINASPAQHKHERLAVSVPRTAPDRSRKNIQTRLLHVLDSADTEPAVVVAMRADIRRLNWPEDVTEARRQVRQMLRGKQDDPVRARLYERLLAELAGPSKSRS